MNLSLNKNGNVELDLYEIISEVIGNATEAEMLSIIEEFALQPKIRKYMIDRLANEFSRPCFCEEIHNDRLELLQKIKAEELSFYASLIVGKMIDEYRHNKAYWELYWWCSNKGYSQEDSFPHQALKTSDWDWRLELENLVIETVKKERHELLEIKGNEI
jgi:hypothetical protein